MGNRPDNHQGWGRLNMGLVFNPTVAVILPQNPTVLTGAGNTWEQTVHANDSGEQPRQPGLTRCTGRGQRQPGPRRRPTTIRVTSAGGTIWRGNVFSGGWSTTGGSADSLNNVENVFVQTPSSGSYTIRVTATALNGDGYYYNGDTTDQHFSLVCWNCAESWTAPTMRAAAGRWLSLASTARPARPRPSSRPSAPASSGATIYITGHLPGSRLGLIDERTWC